MPPYLSSSDRCILFENISSEVWNKIKRAHRVNANLREEGITADIIVDILDFSQNHRSNFEVYARPSYDESTYGSDMDVFVETNPNEYRWFALQAKILKRNNKYTTLRDTSNGTMQWDKLTLLEAVSGCKAYYLLYNGRLGFAHQGNDCKGPFTAEQFGCSLVEPQIISGLANIQTPTGRYINPSFEDIHPHDAIPWRKLVCCLHNVNDYRLYSEETIIASNPKFKKIDTDRIQNNNEFEVEDGNEKQDNDIPLVPENIINTAIREAKWNPAFRIIIKRSLA